MDALHDALRAIISVMSPFETLVGDNSPLQEPLRILNARLQLSEVAAPKLGIILGSGLGAASDRLLKDSGRSISFSELPGMPVPHIAGHAGKLILGVIQGHQVLMLSGRVHSYEGRTLDEVSFATRLLAAAGVQTLILTNAAGGICSDFRPGDLMLIRDHLRVPLMHPVQFGTQNRFDQPGARPEGAPFSARRSCESVWSTRLRNLARSIPAELTIHDGVYAMMPGPNYETPAEIRMLRKLGADAVGMSTVPEALVATSLGLEVLGISCITNCAAGLTGQTLSHSEVTATATAVEDRFVNWMWNLIPAIASRQA